MAKYAKNTKVPIERSRIEIEKILKRYGINNFFFGTSPRGDGIGFEYNGRTIKFGIPLPKRNDFKAIQTGEQDYKRALRQRYRVLVIALKSKLEMVDIGLTTFEDEFLAQTCLTGGRTVGEALHPQIEKMLQTGDMPNLLPAGQKEIGE
jgi:hypothetical protein